jgi:hypothetical protein
MALINNNMAVIGDQIRHDAPANHALHEGDIDDPGRFLLAAMDDSEATWRDVQK